MTELTESEKELLQKVRAHFLKEGLQQEASAKEWGKTEQGFWRAGLASECTEAVSWLDNVICGKIKL